MWELGFYILFALLGSVLGGPKFVEQTKEIPNTDGTQIDKKVGLVTQKGLGSFFSSARFVTGYTLGLNLIFSGLSEISNYFHRSKTFSNNKWVFILSIIMAILILVAIFAEYIYLLIVSLVGHTPQEVDLIASQLSEGGNPTKLVEKDNKQLSKNAKNDLIGFFINSSVLVNDNNQ